MLYVAGALLHGRAQVVVGVRGRHRCARIRIGALLRVRRRARISGEWVDVVGRRIRGVQVTTQARFAISHQDGNGHAARSLVHRAQLECLILTLAFALVAPVLEPDFHLRRRQLQHVGQLLALGRREVALLFEAPLEFVHLRLREQHTRFALLALSQQMALLAVVGAVGRRRFAVARLVHFRFRFGGRRLRQTRIATCNDKIDGDIN